MRKLVSIFRRMVIGPSLDKLSRLSHAELSNLVLMSSEDPVMGLIKKSVTNSTTETPVRAQYVSDPDILRMLQELRGEQARLAEKVEVLERVLAKAR